MALASHLKNTISLPTLSLLRSKILETPEEKTDAELILNCTINRQTQTGKTLSESIEIMSSGYSV